MRWSRLSLVALATIAAGAASASEFWAVLSDYGPLSELTIVIGNPDPLRPATVTVDDESGPVASAVVAPLASHQFLLPRDRRASGSVLARVAYRVWSDLPVNGYQVLPFSWTTGTARGSLLVERSRCGTEYLALTYGADQETRPSVVTVVAPGPARVEVWPAADVVAGFGVAAIPAGASATFDLAAFDVLQIATFARGDDLTGTVVRSDSPVAVYASCDECTIGFSAADGIQEAMLPLSSWSTTIAAIATDPSTVAPNLFRILSAQDGTVVTTDPVQTGTPATIDRGRFIEVQTDENFMVRATAPVLVAQYVYKHLTSTAQGDPEMRVMLPESLFATRAVFAIPANSFPTLFVDWVDIVARPGVNVLVDGVPVLASAFTPIGSGGLGHAFVRIDSTVATHRVEADRPVGMYGGHVGPSVGLLFPLAIGCSDTSPPELSRDAIPLKLTKRGVDVLFSWEDMGSSAAAYNLYSGTIGSIWDHAGLACALGGSTVVGGRREAVLAVPGAHYFLMSASNCGGEGPTGGDPARSDCPP